MLRGVGFGTKKYFPVDGLSNPLNYRLSESKVMMAKTDR